MRIRVAAAVALLLLFASGAHAREKTEDLCKKAQDFVRDGKAALAADIYASALADAQKRKDLDAEWRIAQSMRRAPWDDTGAATALQRVMGALDAKRAGVCVSAHLCAGELVMLATRTGNRKHLGKAPRILAAFAKRPKTGACARAMATYAAGLAAASDGNYEDAAQQLEKAFDVALKQGWTDLAVYVGTERAAIALEQDAPAVAIAAMKRTAIAVPDASDRGLTFLWRTLVQNRLAGAPEEVLAPWKYATGGDNTPGGSVSAKGGRGGRGGKGGRAGVNGGAPPLTPFEKFYKKAGSSKVLFSVRRAADGMLVGHGFDKKFAHTQPFQPQIRHHAEAGVVLAFWNTGVAVLMVEPSGRHGAPGESAGDMLPPPFLGLHHLGKGETLQVTRAGVRIR